MPSGSGWIAKETATRRGSVAHVVVAHDAVLGTDHETDRVPAGVGETGEHVVEERPPDRDHRLDARVGDGRLRGIQRRAILPPHARAEPARENHRLSRRRRHAAPRVQRRGSRRASATPLATKIAIQTAAAAVRP